MISYNCCCSLEFRIAKSCRFVNKSKLELSRVSVVASRFCRKQPRTEMISRETSAVLTAFSKPPEERPDAKHHLKVRIGSRQPCSSPLELFPRHWVVVTSYFHVLPLMSHLGFYISTLVCARAPIHQVKLQFIHFFQYSKRYKQLERVDAT